ncbi:MAG: hypothetical protein BGO98_08855 [Myxococcales bacterium 68-20]|nr:hypothetical protein [Myxococcales bacterium]OJY25101.1 MAG: hypothetical protein BGO98_08855 [Myxococcales bacterium 68-20]
MNCNTAGGWSESPKLFTTLLRALVAGTALTAVGSLAMLACDPASRDGDSGESPTGAATTAPTGSTGAAPSGSTSAAPTGSTTNPPTPPATVGRPYGPKAPWNVPVAGIPVHPQSSTYANHLWNDNAAHHFEVNVRKYTYPVYETSTATDVYTVVDKNNWGNLGGKQVPYNPAWLPNAGTDSQVILLDPATGREWNLWEVAVDVNAKRLTIGNGNLCPGDYRTNNWDDPKTKCTGSRGVGINYLAMLVRPWEIAQGKIEHALSMPIQGTSGSSYVAPATKLEHPGKVGNIPEGMRFALDVTEQEIDAHLDSITGLRPKLKQAIRVILVALKDYGWFITDTSGGAALQLEAPESAQKEWEQVDVLPQQSIGAAQYPRTILSGFMTEQRIRAYVPSDQYP